MTKFQALDELKKRQVIALINHSLTYDNESFREFMKVVKNSKPTKTATFFNKNNKN